MLLKSTISRTVSLLNVDISVLMVEVNELVREAVTVEAELAISKPVALLKSDISRLNSLEVYPLKS